MAIGKLYIGRKVRELRDANRATQGQFAERIGISTSYLNQIENNQRPVSASVLLALAEKFQIDIAATPPLGSVGAPIDHENSREEAIYDRETPAAAEQVRGKEPLDAIVQEIAADLQRLALGAHDA